MARPRKPSNVLELKGAFSKNPKRGAARANEPDPVGDIGEAPAYLDENEKACWHEIVKMCHAGSLCAADALIVEHGARVLAALRAALVEELIVVGYLFTRLREFGWKTWQIILTSAALRGSYHLYQGFGPFVGNFVMGVVFGLAYQRWGRTMPLVIAHWILDIVSFTGYAVVKALAPGFLPGT